MICLHHVAVFCYGAGTSLFVPGGQAARAPVVLAGDGQGVDGDIGLNERRVNPAGAVG